ncbi:MAG: YrzI family small protein [Ectobacillus sp.]
MVFNFLFFTIVVKKRKRSAEEMRHDACVQQAMEELKERQAYRGL